MNEYRNVMVIAPNAELRRSIAFLLEAEGYEVTAYPGVPAHDMSPKSRRRCAIVDDAALDGEPDVWSRLGAIAETFVMLLDGTRLVPPSFPALFVEKPLLGLTLVEAVRNALLPASDPST